MTFAASLRRVGEVQAQMDLPPHSCYQFFGLDFLIDENHRAWLMEVNATPSMKVRALRLGSIPWAAAEARLRLVSCLKLSVQRSSNVRWAGLRPHCSVLSRRVSVPGRVTGFRGCCKFDVRSNCTPLCLGRRTARTALAAPGCRLSTSSPRWSGSSTTRSGPSRWTCFSCWEWARGALGASPGRTRRRWRRCAALQASVESATQACGVDGVLNGA